MRVLITGATGFVGLNIAQALIDYGHDVVSFQRPGARRSYLDRFGVRTVVGQFSDYTELHASLKGVDAIIHTAGLTSCDWREIAALEEANVHSTRALFEAAKACGVRRFIYTSSTATIGSHGMPTRPADERELLHGFRSRSPYAVTKQRAESMLLNSTSGPDCIVLNPAEVVGPFDHTLQWGRMVLAVAGNQLPFIPPGSGTFSPARDVALAHVAALTQGRPGQRYILGGHHVAFSRFIDLVAQAVQRPVAPQRTRPYALLRAQAQLQEWLQPLAGKPAVDAFRMRVFAGHHLFDDSKARSELGYAPRSLRVALEECVQWYRAERFLPPTPPEPGPSFISTNEWKTA